MKDDNSDKSQSLPGDDLFWRWLVESTPEPDLFRSQETTENCDLKNIITKLKTEEPVLPAEEKELMWNRIKQATGEAKELKKSHQVTTAVRIAAAAVLIGLLAGLYVYFSRNKQQDIDYMSMIDRIHITQSDHISLVLADNKVVDIAKDSLEVVYDHTGKIKIDEQAIEPAAGNEQAAILHQLIVPYGKTTSLTLSDGTKIWVNSGSKLIYPSVFGNDKREIFCSGEIYLDVAKKERCPFIVKTGYMEINVKGTRFNISAYKDEATHSVVLVSGAVSVRGEMLDDAYDIYPNQMLSYEAGSKNADVLEVDASHHISWIHGYLHFQGERIDRVLQKLEKYFNVSFTYKGSGFDTIYVRGKLDLSGSVENILDYICLTTSLSYIVNDENIEIINK
ncbi:MAG: FecR family protein [Tannerella sp.]|nr:FecR family protein [Tannerella sp.]